MTTIKFIVIALAFVPTMLVLVVVFTWFAVQKRRARVPFKDKLLSDTHSDLAWLLCHEPRETRQRRVVGAKP